MTALRLGSLFDGIGVFPLAAVRCGIVPAWASEIEKAPISITKRHFPGMAHLGDVTKLNGGDIPPVHIITFGSPCQDMSIAGKRSGLDGSRSSLFYEAIRIIKEMRCATNGKYPRYCVWENVPGAFSSNGGRDFQSVLETVIGVKEADARLVSLAGQKDRVLLGNALDGQGTKAVFVHGDAGGTKGDHVLHKKPPVFE